MDLLFANEKSMSSRGKMRLYSKFRIHPRTRFTTYYPNPFWASLAARTFDSPFMPPAAGAPVRNVLCDLNFVTGTNCLTNRIFTIATSHRRSKAWCFASTLALVFLFLVRPTQRAIHTKIQSTNRPKWFASEDNPTVAFRLTTRELVIELRIA